MGVVYVGVGEYATSNKPDTIIRTMALGSCVAIITFAPKHRAVGLIHIALPDSKSNQKRALEKPGYFADTGIPVLLKEMQQYGCDLRRDLKIKIIGGASIMDNNNIFNIGKKNLLAIRKILWKYKLGPIAQHVEGKISRTVSVTPIDLIVRISSPGRGEWTI